MSYCSTLRQVAAFRKTKAFPEEPVLMCCQCNVASAPVEPIVLLMGKFYCPKHAAIELMKRGEPALNAPTVRQRLVPIGKISRLCRYKQLA